MKVMIIHSSWPSYMCKSVTDTNLMNLKVKSREFLAVQWLGLCALTAEGPGSIPGLGTKIPQPCGAAKTIKKEEGASSSKSFWPLLTKLVQYLIPFAVTRLCGFLSLTPPPSSTPDPMRSGFVTFLSLYSQPLT